METARANIRLQIIVVIVGVVLLAAKFAAYFLTKSNAILTDALESIINVVAGSFALYSIILASKPRDLNHPYGHGKIEFISATIEGGLIFLAGGSIIVKSIYNLFNPHELDNLDIGIVLVVIAGAVNYGVGALIETRGARTGSLTMIAGGKHLKSDAYSTLGLVVGLIIIYLTGYKWVDNVAAIIFGGLICVMGVRILRRSIAGIMDEADYELLKEIIEILQESRTENWIDVHNLRVIKYGATFHIDCHLTVPYYFNVRQAHGEVTGIERLISSKFDNAVEIFIHIDDCIPASCRICDKGNCPERSFGFEQKVLWNLETGMTNMKHSVDSPG